MFPGFVLSKIVSAAGAPLWEAYRSLTGFQGRGKDRKRERDLGQ